MPSVKFFFSILIFFPLFSYFIICFEKVWTPTHTNTHIKFLTHTYTSTHTQTHTSQPITTNHPKPLFPQYFHTLHPPPTHTPPTPSTRTPTRLLAPDVIVVLPQIGAGQGAEGVHEGVRASYFYHVVVVVRNVLAQEGLRPRAEGAAVELRSEKEASFFMSLFISFVYIFTSFCFCDLLLLSLYVYCILLFIHFIYLILYIHLSLCLNVWLSVNPSICL